MIAGLQAKELVKMEPVLYLIVAFTAVSSGGRCLAQSEGPSSVDFSVISNSDVTWAHTIVGWQPVLSGKTKEIYERTKIAENNLSPLVDMLDDPKKFVVAHVLLTYLTKSKFLRNSDSWNGLKVKSAGSEVRFSTEQCAQLKQDWKERLRILQKTKD
jgi:hypothetical protein